ncbi:MAG: glycine--tRNA ligase subunit beta, partial [Syntrophales bacterium]|nr:glycine--tRNA ligase subunit beta [Syntrophales bacterium]
MGRELLLEIGTEEIPAAFLPKAMTDMKEIIASTLDDARIKHGQVVTMATPRRLVVKVEDVAETQEDQVLEKIGPAKKAAFDESGNPSKAALGFAKGQGVDVSALETVQTEKGEYLCVRKTIRGVATVSLLPDLLTHFITSIPFRKSMRWSHFDIRFARPIHWILAIFGGDVVPLRLENITSGRQSCGHRFMSPVFFTVENFMDYLEKARRNFVIVDPAERKDLILRQLEDAAREVGGVPLNNDELLEEVTFLVEYPTVVRGSFDAAYLKLPKEVLITSMMSHQKYFPIMDNKGALMPYFLTVNNTLARDPAVVARGNEKVIRARLADARFFFDEDQKVPLEQRVEDLKKVVYHSLLGTSYEKVARFRALAAYIAEKVAPARKETVDRAAFLA